MGRAGQRVREGMSQVRRVVHRHADFATEVWDAPWPCRHGRTDLPLALRKQDPIQGMAGWFGNLASTVAGQIDEMARPGHTDSAAAPAPQGGGGGWGKSSRQRSVDEQRAFELKVSLLWLQQPRRSVRFCAGTLP